MSRSKLIVLFVVLSIGGAIVAQAALSTNERAGAAQIQPGGTLVAARAADVVLWDPAHINENDSLWAGFQTNANLISATPDGKGFQPYIAKSWKISKGGRVFTFQLFPNAKFCDGSPITANDVVFSFKRASNP